MNKCAELHGNYTLTDHAQRQAQQRGIDLQTVQCILYHADVKKHRGDGKLSLAISKKKIKNLDKQGYPLKTREKVGNVVVLVEPVCKKVVSVWHSYKRAKRRDFHQFSTHSVSMP